MKLRKLYKMISMNCERNFDVESSVLNQRCAKMLKILIRINRIGVMENQRKQTLFEPSCL